MAKNLYVGNLSYSVNDEILNELFSQYGKVDSARAITDRETGRSKGFGLSKWRMTMKRRQPSTR